MSDKIRIDIKEIAKAMTATLKAEKDVNKVIGEKAAEMYIEGMALQVANENIKGFMQSQVGVPQSPASAMQALAQMQGKKPGPGGIVQP
jgi:hypothetical protein